MSRTLKEAPLTTANARLKLKAGVHWRAIDADIHLGYRKGTRAGRWLVRWYLGQQRYERETIGSADDEAQADGLNVFSFTQAKNAAVDIVVRKRAEAAIAATGEIPTVGSVVESYMASRDARHLSQGGTGKSDARRRLTRHVICDEELCAVNLHDLTVDHLRRWTRQWPDSLAASSLRRISNDFKAALNAAADSERERMPPGLPGTIKFGLAAGEDSAPVSRDKQALPDDDIRKIIEAARIVDAESQWDGDLLRMILVLAATGARFSQVRRLAVGDVQPDQCRLMVPTSRKGRGTKKVSHTAVRVGEDVIEALRPELIGRKPSEPLLRRWRHTQVPDSDGSRRPKWERSSREAWVNASELGRPWAAILTKAGMSKDIVPYAFRHSSIVRQLRRGLPVQLVAKSHDTSAAIIERHYASAIIDALDDLAAKAVIPLVAQQADNVVPMRR